MASLHTACSFRAKAPVLPWPRRPVPCPITTYRAHRGQMTARSGCLPHPALSSPAPAPTGRAQPSPVSATVPLAATGTQTPEADWVSVNPGLQRAGQPPAPSASDGCPASTQAPARTSHRSRARPPLSANPAVAGGDSCRAHGFTFSAVETSGRCTSAGAASAHSSSPDTNAGGC